MLTPKREKLAIVLYLQSFDLAFDVSDFEGADVPIKKL
jgi:hypothetical protein